MFDISIKFFNVASKLSVIVSNCPSMIPLDLSVICFPANWYTARTTKKLVIKIERIKKIELFD
jgi:hypothetical protein